VSFPQDHPLAFVSVKPHAGWDVQVTETPLDAPVDTGEFELTEAVSTITWTAQPGTRIAPGQFEEFDVSVGPLPADVDELAFPAVQTYDDGEVVNWDEPVVEGEEEPELPAPTLALLAGEEETDASQASATSESTDDASAPERESSDGAARALGASGLAVGALGLVAAAVAIRTARRSVARS
jgi:periplasmic copper chaperone A